MTNFERDRTSRASRVTVLHTSRIAGVFVGTSGFGAEHEGPSSSQTSWNFLSRCFARTKAFERSGYAMQ